MKLCLSKEGLFRLYLLLNLLVLLKAFTWIYTGQGAYILDDETSNVMRMHSLLTLVLISSLFAFYWKPLIFDRSLWLIWLIFFYFLLSAFWAFEFKETVRMCRSLFFQIMVAVAITKGANLATIVSRLAYVGKGIIALNLIFAVGFSSLAFETGYFEGSYEGAMRGIFSSKNTFGAIIAFAYSMFLLEFLYARGRDKIIIFGWILLSCIFLLLSMSATSWIAAICATALMMLASSPQFIASRQISRVTLILIFFSTISLLALTIEPILKALGRDLTFTGRTILWEFAWDNFLENPIFGYGLNSFWRKMLHFDLLEQNGLWNIGQAHNGFVDALLAGGVIGGGLVLAVYLKMFFDILRELTRLKVTRSLSVLLVLFWLSLIQNLTETSFPYSMRITGTLIAVFFIISSRLNGAKR